MAGQTTIHVQRCLDRLKAGDEAARHDLIDTACDRLTRLTRKMLHADGRVQRWEQTDDVFQRAMLRLCRALQHVTPQSPREFLHLAALQIRRELVNRPGDRGLACSITAARRPPDGCRCSQRSER